VTSDTRGAAIRPPHLLGISVCKWLLLLCAYAATSVSPLVLWVLAQPKTALAQESSGKLVVGFGQHSLSSMGASDFVFPLDRALERKSVFFRLPSGARQGPDKWYLIRLHFRIVFKEEAGAGAVLLSGLTNGRSAAQIRFQYRRSSPRAPIYWSTLDYIRGLRRHRTQSRVIDVRFSNYLQYSGVRPKRNAFTVQYERFGDIHVESIRVFRDSGIAVTPLSPARLKIRIEDRPVRVAEGAEFPISYTVENIGGQLARDVVVTATTSTGIKQLSGDVRRTPRLRASMHGTLHLKAVGAGPAAVLVLARSATNRPGVRIPLIIVSRESLTERAAGLAPQVLGALLILVGASLLWRRKLIKGR
jgi:hypothetical protein